MKKLLWILFLIAAFVAFGNAIFGQCTVQVNCTDLRSLIEDYKQIELDTGTFYTPEYPVNRFNYPVLVGADQIRISGNGVSVIKRPDQSLGTETNKDFYHGLYFAPENASQTEIDSAYWTNYNYLYDYFTISRGSLVIENLIIDCNMQNQGIQDGDKVEHSGMIRVNGRIQDYQGKKIMLALKEVIIKNVQFINGGAADNIYIGRSYFKPNIQHCHFESLTEGPRVLPKRGSITASSTAERIDIINCDLYKVELEESNLTNWDTAPGPDSIIGTWTIQNCVLDKLDIAHKGHDVYLDVQNTDVTHSSLFYQVAGKVSQCTLNVQDNLIRMNRLRGMTFEECQFLIHPGDDGYTVRGIKPVGQYGEPCHVIFDRCDFQAVADNPSGALITSEYSPGETINVTVLNCTFDPRTEYTIQAHERGSYFITGMSLQDMNRMSVNDKQDIQIDACINF